MALLFHFLTPHVAAAPIPAGATGEFTVEPPKLAVATKARADVKERIAWCESRNNPLAKNPHSTAKGIYQFLDGTWRSYAQRYWGAEWVNKSVLDEEDNRELGEWVIDNYGTADWNASKHCWG